MSRSRLLWLAQHRVMTIVGTVGGFIWYIGYVS